MTEADLIDMVKAYIEGALGGAQQMMNIEPENKFYDGYSAALQNVEAYIKRMEPKEDNHD